MDSTLPACEHLGYSLNMLEATPANINSVIASVKRSRKVIQYQTDSGTRDVVIGKLTYKVPACIGVIPTTSAAGKYITSKSGSEANNDFQADASLSVSYLAVSGSTSASYATEKMFRQENQYAFYSLNASTYLAALREYGDLLNEESLKKRLKDMPSPFNEAHAERWREFFRAWGTHVIMNAAYGARYQLEVHASNSDSSVNNRFSASVKASYNGVLTGGEVDTSVKKENQYKTFSTFKQDNVAVKGGDPVLANRLAASPNDYELFKEWAESLASISDLVNYGVVEIWALLREANAEELQHIAPDAEKAFEYLASHHDMYSTEINLSIEADWAEFGLLTPSAVIRLNEKRPVPTMTVLSETRVQWGREHSHEYERQTVPFVVINDGSPIDFYISHGSEAGRTGKGKATIIIQRDHYTNDKITDNNWNTEWYFQKAVSTNKVQKAESTPCKFPEALRSYLIKAGHY